MTKRRFITQLPGIQQTNTLKKFFSATIDQVFQPGETQSINAFIGKKPGYYKPQKDFYKVEINPEREFYQLEPAMTTSNADGSFADLLFYTDVVNNLRFQGANTTDHSRLFDTDYYSWCPPINIAKLDKYREYFWMPDGPPIMVFDIKKTKIVVTTDTINYFPFPELTPDSTYHLVIKVNDEVMIDDFIIDGNLDDNKIIDGAISINSYDGNVLSGFTIENNGVIFDTPLNYGDVVQIWVNADFKQNIVGKESYHYPIFASVYAVEEVIEQYIDPESPTGVSSRKRLETYPEKSVPTPPYLVSDMRIRIDDNNGSNLYQVNIIDGKIDLMLVSDLISKENRTPDYVTIERGATNHNDWSIGNHWYHKSTMIYTDGNFVPEQAVRPIIEYFNNIQLFNYGVNILPPVDMVVSNPAVAFVDNPTNGISYDINLKYDFNKRYDAQLIPGMIAGSAFIDGVELLVGDRILVTSSDDVETSNNILTITSTPAKMLYDFEMASDTNYDEELWDDYDILGYTTQVTKKLDQVAVVDSATKLWFNGVNWNLVPEFNKSPPLFDLFDREQISLSDPIKYPLSKFNGSHIFFYDIADARPMDDVLDLRVVRNKYGLIVFKDHLATDKFTYIDGAISGYNYFGLSTTVDSATTLKFRNNWHLAGTTKQEANADGFFNIPQNLQSNPLNKEIDTISPNDWNTHFTDLLSANDWTMPSDQFDLSAGKHIIQSRGSMLKTMLINSDTSLDFIKTSTHIEHEYSRYRSKFVQLLKQYEMQNARMDTNDAVTAIILQLKSTKTTDFPFYNNGVAGDYFIPATGAYLGMTPLWQPEFIVENGKNGSIVFIRGHDGSMTPGFSRFTSTTIKIQDGTLVDGGVLVAYDPKDLVIFALEQMIYDSVLPEVKARRRPVFDLTKYTAGKFRESEYSRDEYLNVTRPIFERWVSKNSLKYRTNTAFNINNPWTFNYSDATDVDGDSIPGFWRGIYQYYFDTDRPHTHPWEILGFTVKPIWWDTAYSWTDDTKRQALLSALTMGLVSSPNSNQVCDATFARGRKFDVTTIQAMVDSHVVTVSETVDPTTNLNVLSYFTAATGSQIATVVRFIDPKSNDFTYRELVNCLPVDEFGVLLNPIQAGIVLDNGVINYAKDWNYGDLSPIEYQWTTSNSRSFTLSQVSYLLKPVRFVESNWETSDEIEVNGYDWVSSKTGGRKQISDYTIHNEIVAGSPIRVLGLQSWISDYLRSLGKDVTSSFGDRVRKLNTNLAHKMGGFIDTQSLKAFTENSGLIPQEDVNLVTYKSPSIREEFYSGVLVQWTGRGWKVIGYDIVHPVFNTFAIDSGGPKVKVTIDGVTDSFASDWHQNTYYPSNVLIQYKGFKYRCTKTHTSSRTFEAEFWSQDGRDDNGSTNSLIYHRSHYTDVVSVPYGTEFKSRQAVADFLSGYEAYLISRGWNFEQYDSDINEVRDWKYSTKEFLNWTQVSWAENTFIALSPSAASAKFNNSHGSIQNVEQLINGSYALLGKEGTAISKNQVEADRTEDGITVSVTNDAIYGLRLSITEVEHAVVFKNTTKFNDVIYQPLFNIRQNRIRILALLSLNWTGKLDAPGYIVSNNQVLPSFDKQVSDIRYMYDIEKTINLPLRDNARHQIGYQSRSYLENLMYNEVNQFEFYQGMIQQKGTPSVFDKLMRNDELTQSRQLKFLEEWAFRTGEYGGTDIHNFFEMQFHQTDIQQEPQLVSCNAVNSYWDLGEFDTEPNNGFVVNSDSDVNGVCDVCFEVGAPNNIDNNDNIIELWSTTSHIDDRIIIPNNSKTIFTQKKKYVREKNDLPNAGYARVDEAHWTAMSIEGFNKIILESSRNLEMYQRIWVYDTNTTKQWAMFQASSTTLPVNAPSNTITGVFPHDDGVSITLAYDHNLVLGDSIYVNKAINAVSSLGGIQNVIGILDSHTIIVAGNIVSQYEYLDEQQPEILKLINMRHSITAIADVGVISEKTIPMTWSALRAMTPEGGFQQNELIYIDINFALYQNISDSDKHWAVFIYNADTNQFESYRTQPERIRSDLIRDVKIFDTLSVRTSQVLNAKPLLNSDVVVYDPTRGLISGVADKEIWYKLEFDPAYYNSGDYVETLGLDWGDAEVGRLWWDLNTTRYIDSCTDDLSECQLAIVNLNIEIARLSLLVDSTTDSAVIDEHRQSISRMHSEIVSREAKIQRESKYRKDYWGSLAPHSTIDIYEWTKSDVSPTEWNALSLKGTKPDLYSGIVLNANSPKWVETEEWNDKLSAYVPVYYFWVKGKNTVPTNADFRSISALAVSRILTKPEDSGFVWIAPITIDSFIASGIGQYLNSSSSIQLKIAKTDSDVLRHIEYDLMRQGDERSVPTRELWNKVVKSIAGRNTNGEIIPSTSRHITDQVGYDVEHGQSLFGDISGARKHLTQYLNNLFAGILLVDERRNTAVLNSADLEDSLLQWYQKTDSYYISPKPDSKLYDRQFKSISDFEEYIGLHSENEKTTGLISSYQEDNVFWSVQKTLGKPNITKLELENLWDLTVDSITELNSLLVGDISSLFGKRIKVLGDSSTGGFATIWKLAESQESFELVTTQRFNSSDIYEFVDWVSSDYKTSKEPIIQFDNVIARDSVLGTDPVQKFVKILDDGNGRWMWTSFIGNSWKVVAKERGTIKLLDSVWSNTGNRLNVGSVLPEDFKAQVSNRDLGYELDYFMNSLRDNILTSTELNQLFFSMVDYAHSEQNSIDWCFKTSFMYVTGYSERLLQDPIAYLDRTSNLLQYINEVKPYHVKMRDFISKYGVSNTANVHAMDFDFPAYYDKVLGKFRQLDPSVFADKAIIETGVWNNWLQQYQYANNSLTRKLKLKIGQYDYKNEQNRIIDENVVIPVAESVRIRLFKKGDIGAPVTESQVQDSTNGVSVKLKSVLQSTSALAVFADGLRIDPALVSFDEYTSRVQTAAIPPMTVIDGNLPDGVIVDSPGLEADTVDGDVLDGFNKLYRYEVASFGYGATNIIREIKYFTKTSDIRTFDLGLANADVTQSQLMVTVAGVRVTPTVINRMVSLPDTAANGLVQIAILDRQVKDVAYFNKTDEVNTFNLGANFADLTTNQIRAFVVDVPVVATITRTGDLSELTYWVNVPQSTPNGSITIEIVSGDYVFVRQFNKTTSVNSFELNKHWPSELINDLGTVAESNVKVTIPEISVYAEISNGVITIPKSTITGSIRIAILNGDVGTFSEITTSRFEQADFTGKSFIDVCPEMIDSDRYPLMNNFIIEVDGLRKMPEMIYSTDINTFNKVLRLERHVLVSKLDVRFNHRPIVVADQLSRTYTILASEREVYIGQNPALQDITVTDSNGNDLIIGQLTASLIVLDEEHPQLNEQNTVLGAMPWNKSNTEFNSINNVWNELADYASNFKFYPENADLILYRGHLISLTAMTTDQIVKVKISNYIPDDFTHYDWVPANATFVQVNDAIVNTDPNNFGLLTVIDKQAGEFDLFNNIDSEFPEAELITITSLPANDMGSRTWTFNTKEQDYFPINSLPANDSSLWVNLNGRRLINNVDYQIIDTTLPGWDCFRWDIDSFESENHQMRGTVHDEGNLFDVDTWEELGAYDTKNTFDSSVWDESSSYDSGEQNTYGIKLLVTQEFDQILIATVFENKQSTYAREFELNRITPGDYDTVLTDLVWDRQPGIACEINQNDKYELVNTLNNNDDECLVRELPNPHTTENVGMAEFENISWIENEMISMTNVISENDQILSNIERGAYITSQINHDTKSVLVAPKPMMDFNYKVPL